MKIKLGFSTEFIFGNNPKSALSGNNPKSAFNLSEGYPTKTCHPYDKIILYYSYNGNICIITAAKGMAKIESNN